MIIPIHMQICSQSPRVTTVEVSPHPELQSGTGSISQLLFTATCAKELSAFSVANFFSLIIFQPTPSPFQIETHQGPPLSIPIQLLSSKQLFQVNPSQPSETTFLWVPLICPAASPIFLSFSSSPTPVPLTISLQVILDKPVSFPLLPETSFLSSLHDCLFLIFLVSAQMLENGRVCSPRPSAALLQLISQFSH